MPCSDHAVILRAWHGRGMASVNQTRPHRVNQMGKTHSKPLAAGMAGERHAMCESAFSVPLAVLTTGLHDGNVFIKTARRHEIQL